MCIKNASGCGCEALLVCCMIYKIHKRMCSIPGFGAPPQTSKCAFYLGHHLILMALVFYLFLVFWLLLRAYLSQTCDVPGSKISYAPQWHFYFILNFIYWFEREKHWFVVPHIYVFFGFLCVFWPGLNLQPWSISMML